MIAWYNGELTPLDAISIHPTDRGFLLGDGLFETLALRQGQGLYLEAHLNRLQQAAHQLGFPTDLDVPQIKAALQDLVLANPHIGEQASARITLSRGSGPRGLLPPKNVQPKLLITIAAAPTDFPALRLKTVSIRRNEFSPTSRIKSLCYLDNILALEEAQQQGAHDALILNTQGRIAETAICNLFFIQNDTVKTPPLSDGCLGGVMRAAVLRGCQKLNITYTEASLTPHDLTTCSSAFATNSLCRVRPITQIDDHEMTAHDIIEQLTRFIEQDEAVS